MFETGDPLSSLPDSNRLKIAVIGAGVSGLVAARLLATRHDVQLFEASDKPGGHANTVDVQLGEHQASVDTGFMVFNERTYPNFCRLLSSLDVATQPSDMSFSVCCEQSGLEYQGSSLGGLFSQRSNLFRPSFYKFLADIIRFNRDAREYLQQEVNNDTLGEFLRQRTYGTALRDKYLLPMTGAIWSTSPTNVLDFPAHLIVGFMENHGLLQLRDRPQWKTIAGGSRKYVEALAAPLRNRLRTKVLGLQVTRLPDHVIVQQRDKQPEIFDAVVFATHSDQAMQLLTDVDKRETSILRAFPYQENKAVLHSDVSLLPRRKAAWASWNYRIAARACSKANVTYDLRRLQRIEFPVPLLLTLNPSQEIAKEKVLQEFTYHHPLFSSESRLAQSRWSEINGPRRTFYCGAYWKNGFHEDGVVSALNVTQLFGIGLDACRAACIKETLHTAEPDL